MTDVVALIADNFVLLLALVGGVLIVAFVATALARVSTNRHREKMAALMMEQTKLQMVHRRELLHDYTNAAVVLNDTERARIDAINEDLATLSRRAIALMTEVDARTTRLERGVEIAKMSTQLNTIRQNEAKLFAQQR